MRAILLPAVRMLGILTVITGVVYPTILTVLGKALFPTQAAGNLLAHKGKVIGSMLLAQDFTNSVWFWPRPSANSFGCIPAGASNQGPTTEALRAAVRRREAAFQRAHGLEPEVWIPSEMLFASGSGLDPHISPEAARMQIGRVADARRLDIRQKEQLAELVERHVEPPQLGFLGEARVNILLLNLALDELE